MAAWLASMDPWAKATAMAVVVMAVAVATKVASAATASMDCTAKRLEPRGLSSFLLFKGTAYEMFIFPMVKTIF